MRASESGAHLQQLLCTLQWVRFTLSYLTSSLESLHDPLERACDSSRNHIPLAISSVRLVDCKWGISERDAFNAC